MNGIVSSVKVRLAGPFRKLFPRKKPGNWDVYRKAIEQKIGLEIGGPSRLWASGHFLPIYAACQYVDGCNFAGETVWEGKIHQGPYHCEGAHGKGRQYIADAVDLAMLRDPSYDFVLSCHCLEHIANPIKAVKEWIRVLKPNGFLVLAVPHRDGFLSLVRSVSSLAHIVNDYESNITEHDMTHLEELIEANTKLKDEASKQRERDILLRNFEHRMMHHHSFDPTLVVSLVDYVGMQVRAVNLLEPYQIVCLAEKLGDSQLPNNLVFFSKDADYLKNTPFSVDRRCVRN
jgi:SAM-dependent methyltransferase